MRPILQKIADSAFWPMLWKEFLQMRRDRLTLAMMVVLPAIQLVLFGYAIRTEVRHLPTVVLDESRTAESRELVETIRNTGNFDIVGTVRGRDEMDDWIRRGAASAGLVIPADFATAVAQLRGEKILGCFERGRQRRPHLTHCLAGAAHA